MTPEEQDQERVRRLLADSAGPEPTPDAVRDRLDAVLADLVAERAAGAPPGDLPGELPPVAPLPRRRRAAWAKGLVAAAAVAVVAYGVGTVVSHEGTNVTSSSAGSASSADRQAQASAGQKALLPSSSAGGSAPVQHGRYHLAEARLHTATLRRDLRRLTARFDTVRGGAAGAPQHLENLPSPRAGCVIPPSGRGDDVYPVRLDGKPATVVLRRAVAGTRVVDVYACDNVAPPLVHTRLPVR
ncbi:MAG: hypothetical protein ACXVW9_02885 [Nocardioidaceae bacterium]